MNNYTIYLFASFIGERINRLEKLLLMSDTKLQSLLVFSTQEIPYSGNYFLGCDRKNIRKYKPFIRGDR